MILNKNKYIHEILDIRLFDFYCFIFTLTSVRNISVISLTSWFTTISNCMYKSLWTLITLSFLSIKISKIRTFNTIFTIPQWFIQRTKTLIGINIKLSLCKTLTPSCTRIEHSWQRTTYRLRLYRNRIKYLLLLLLTIFI